AVTLAWGPPYYTKLAMSIVGGRPPAVAILHASRLPSYAPAGLLEPLDPAVLTQYNIGPDRFLPEVWEGMQFEGRPYAVPLDIHPFILYYNIDVCRQAGLLDPDGNLIRAQGPDALIDMFRRAQGVTGQLGLTYGTMGVAPWRLFSGLYAQLGGQVLSPDGEQLILDDAKAEQALNFMRELTIGSKVAAPNQSGEASVALFSNASGGFHLNGGWEVTTFQTEGIPFSAVPFPNVFGTDQTWADSHVFVLPRQPDDDPDRLDASLRFISFMLQNSLTWAEGGHIPPYIPVAQSPEFAALQPQANYAATAENPVYDPRAWFSGAAAPLQEEAGAAFGAVLNGQLSPAQGIAQYRAALEDLLQTPEPL
ncbi:MAG: extracellular solute-binding protein, partial [Chloroflexota bacterium]|nr:extracellular solute-binding protein [Chloroflexota bacterium]